MFLMSIFDAFLGGVGMGRKEVVYLWRKLEENFYNFIIKFRFLDWRVGDDIRLVIL